MLIVTDFLDPADNGFDLADLAALVGFVITVTVAGYAASRWANRSLAAKMAAVIEQRTQPLVSGYKNDGNSLTDISDRVGLIVDRQAVIGTEIVSLRDYNEAAHTDLAHRIATVANRLDDHAESPAHDRRRSCTTDTEE